MLPKKCEKPTIKSCACVPLSLYSKYKICKRKGREDDIFTDPSKKKLSQGQSGKREGCGDSFLTVVKVELWTIISKKAAKPSLSSPILQLQTYAQTQCSTA